MPKGQELFRRLLSGTFAKIAEFDVFIRSRDVGSAQCFAKPIETAARIGEMFWTGDYGDPFVAMFYQVACGDGCAEMVVEHDRVDVLEAGPAIEVHQWN